MQKRFLSLVSLLLIATMSVFAQITTASLDGVVVDEGSKETVIGATVQAVHVPSGTKYSAITNSKGRFTIQGMRPGGPYTIVFSYIGYQGKTYEDVMLDLGETLNMQVAISENTKQLSEVVVSGKATKFKAEKTGATTNISSAMINSVPTVSRSITDIARISPYANGMGFAGGDGRSTNFTLDGANLNNNFGLSTNLPGGGTPVSMDAIDEVQVVVAPFDVRQSNFIGGGINAVTKSGTNTFKGTAYVYYYNENMMGNRVNKTELAAREDDRLTTFGFTLGGPIVKDKLFFFANYEGARRSTIVNRWRASADGKSDSKQYLSRTTLSDMTTVSQYLLSYYGYDTGSISDFPADEKNDKFLVRLDWNIMKGQHLALRYNYTNNKGWNNTNGSSSDAATRFNSNRLSENSMAFANSMYSTENSVSTFSADLNSRFGEKFSNQLLFTYSDIQDKRGSDSDPFPFVDILNGYETGVFPVMKGGNDIAYKFLADDGSTYNVQQTIEPYMSLGYELFSYNNKVRNKVITLTDNFTWYAGTHKVTAGFNFEHQMAQNNYMRNGTGYYRYRSLNDFLTGASPETVALTYGYNGDQEPSAKVRFNQYGLYLQDEWNVLKTLKLTAGIRFDNITFNNDDVMTNNAILALDFGGRHIDTGSWPKTNIQISPRLGFTWDVFGDKSLKVRGGTGLFAGRLPLVFFTNMPTNSSMIQNLIVATTNYQNNVVTASDPRLDLFRGGLVTNTESMRQLLGGPSYITPDQGTVPSAIAGVDHDFKMPQVWKTSIALDYQLPVKFPFTVTGEFTYTKNINAVMLDNYNIKPVDDLTAARLRGADNRFDYTSLKNGYRYDPTYVDANGQVKKFTGVAAVLTNTHEGYGWTANVTLNAEPVENLRLMAAYTHTVFKERSGMPGSNASSAWTGLFTINGPNYVDVQNSRYVIPDRLIASISYRYKHEEFSLFYTGYSPSGYSFYYSNDLNGDGIQYDLMYIPANDSEIRFATNEDRVAFWRFVEQDDYLRTHKGEYAEAYSARAPFVHRFDVRFAHNINVKVGNTKHRLQLSADIMNVGNLFNSKWGVEKIMTNNSCNGGKILKVKSIENGVPVFQMNKNSDGSEIKETYDYSYSLGQCWKLQVGLKYFFN